MAEIGSFIELEFKRGKEYFKKGHIVRLNSGRSGIFHSARVLGCDTVYVPYYQCETVRNFLIKKGIKVKYYHIDKDFSPIDLNPSEDEAVIIVNYYGIMSKSRLKALAKSYKNVIIDNSQAFFSPQIEGALCVYSARKFIGVPDGAYVIGNNADKLNDYDDDFSSDTADFLLKRIEYGLEGAAYEARTKNEERIDNSDILNMSRLTRTILDSYDYEANKQKRIENFAYAANLFKEMNEINPLEHFDKSCVPMVYPLVVQNDELMGFLQKNKIFQGRWWKYVLSEVKEDTFEYYLSRYIVPITIDQRYGKKEIELTYNLVKGFLSK